MSIKGNHQENNKGWRILACASQGTGSSDEDRLRALLSAYSAVFVSFDRSQKMKSFLHCIALLRAGNFDLFVLEGTGVAAGMAAILARILWRRPYVLSSGDAVGPFLSARFPAGAPLFALYERLLYRFSVGFIGWTPYLVGRALTLGAKRGVTIPGWAPFSDDPAEMKLGRRTVRAKLNIPEDAVVFGIVGSLTWSKRFGYCYGSELVRAARRSPSPAFVIIVGGGSGLKHLQEIAGDLLGKSVFVCGPVPRHEVSKYLAAMDVGSLPQSVDGVGSFRYTTKLPEYRAAGLKVVTGCIPMAYDLNCGDILTLEGDTPWSDTYIDRLAALMGTLSMDDLGVDRSIPNSAAVFNRELQLDRVTAFLEDTLRSLQKSQT